jgi:dipeptidyl-peptidase-4
MVLAESKLALRDPMLAPEVFYIPTADGIQLPAMLVRPKSAGKNQQVPVVIEVYGGPQAPVVLSRWSGTKSLYRELLARRGIATLVVDNRSSAGRGIADTWSIRGRVGEVEFKDLQTAIEWLKAQPWADSQRIAMRGWSFGGFMTLYAMTHSDELAAGIAGGSVTDWSEYDAFYTERYMGLPSENADGYRSTSPVLRAEQLHGRVLLIHGEADDNVHPSGTMRMAEALQKAGKDFRLMIYPGAAHHVGDPHQAWHMTQMTDRFLLEELTRGPEISQE